MGLGSEIGMPPDEEGIVPGGTACGWAQLHAPAEIVGGAEERIQGSLELLSLQPAAELRISLHAALCWGQCRLWHSTLQYCASKHLLHRLSCAVCAVCVHSGNEHLPVAAGRMEEEEDVLAAAAAADAEAGGGSAAAADAGGGGETAEGRNDAMMSRGREACSAATRTGSPWPNACSQSRGRSTVQTAMRPRRSAAAGADAAAEAGAEPAEVGAEAAAEADAAAAAAAAVDELQRSLSSRWMHTRRKMPSCCSSLAVCIHDK